MGDVVLKWAWRHHVLGVMEFEDLDAALRSAMYASEEGEEAIDHIEIVGEDGTATVLDNEQSVALINRMEAARYAEYRASAAARPVVASLHVATADGTDGAIFDNFQDMDEAEAEYARLAAILGGTRVTLRRSVA